MLIDNVFHIFDIYGVFKKFLKVFRVFIIEFYQKVRETMNSPPFLAAL